MPNVKASDLQTNVHVTKRKDDGSVEDLGWFGPDYDGASSKRTVELAEDHPALVRQRLSAEDIEALAQDNELRTYAAMRAIPVGGDNRAYAGDFRTEGGEVPSNREREAAARAQAGLETPPGAAVASLPKLPEGWEKKDKGTLQAYADARGVTVAPNAKNDDIVEALRNTGA